MSYDDFGVSTPFATVNGGFGVDYAEMNKGVQPIFFTEPVHDAKASEEAGHPRFREEERVRLIIAGDQFNQPVHPVDDAIKERFSVQYEKWKLTHKGMHIEGTPIREWPLLSKVQIAEFEAAKIFSIFRSSPEFARSSDRELRAFAKSEAKRVSDAKKAVLLRK